MEAARPNGCAAFVLLQINCLPWVTGIESCENKGRS